jgi:hypothetical protein
MVLTREELVSSLQNEVRILLHLASKIDRDKLDYRPSPKQRSYIELLRYMSYMAPTLITSIKNGAFDMAAWQAGQAKAEASDFDALVATIGAQSEGCAALLAGYSDADFRGEVDFFGRKTSRGSHLVNMVLSAFAAYRMQLFLYLKACGREELNTMNLWGGIDGGM